MTKSKISIKSIISLIVMILSIISSIYCVYALSLLSGIETLIRLLVSIIIIVLMLCLIIVFIRQINTKSKNKKYIIYSILGLIYALLLFTFGHYIIKTYKVVDNFTSDGTTYSSSLVTLSTNKVEELEDVTGKIGIIDDEKNIIGYEIPNEVIEEEKLNIKIKKYNSYIELISALYEEEIKYAFLPTNYAIMFSSYEGLDLSNISTETKIIYTKEKKVKNKESSKSNTLTEPFTILLMGVDSENEEIAGSSFNGDSLMLLTFNPNTLNATMLSIPRDTYVPITCFAGRKKNKITHAAWYGESCMIDTIENFTGITIDYYVKINFKGLVKIVDTLGGVDVDVPYSFCEQNSDRKFGNDTVYVNKGYQTLNGEQALAFSRNRHPWPQYCGKEYSNYVSNDFIRGQNQQTVLKAILNKIKENGNLDTIYNLLDVVSSSMETNMTTNEILSLYNVGKDVITKSSSGTSIDNIIGIQRLYLSGKDAYIYDSGSGLNLYNFVLYNESLTAVNEAMKINLELIEPTLIKEFSFNIDEEYTENVIGRMSNGTTEVYETNNKINTDKEENDSKEEDTNKEEQKEDNESEEEKEALIEVPNFVGLTYKQAKTKATSLGLYLNPGSSEESNIVATQDTPAGREVKVGVTIKLTFEEKDISEEEPDVPEDDSKDNSTNIEQEEIPSTENETSTEEDMTN